jgi:hypothetical protein
MWNIIPSARQRPGPVLVIHPVPVRRHRRIDLEALRRRVAGLRAGRDLQDEMLAYRYRIVFLVGKNKPRRFERGALERRRAGPCGKGEDARDREDSPKKESGSDPEFSRHAGRSL